MPKPISSISANSLPSEAFSEAANKVASYIVLSSVTSASPFFDAVRIASEERATGELEIRTFALESLGTDSLDVSDKFIDQLCRTVVLDWRGIGDDSQCGPRAEPTNRPPPSTSKPTRRILNRIASDHAAEIGLDLRSLFKAATHLVENQGQVSTAKLINDVVAESLGRWAGSRESADPPLGPILQRIHQFIGVQSAAETELQLGKRFAAKFIS